MLLVAEPKLVELHAAANEYCACINSDIAKANEADKRFPLSGGALFSIRADQFALHRTIMTLCTEGWAFAGSPLLRTMLELMLSTAIIVSSHEETEYLGFKYTHVFLKANLNNEQLPAAQRKRIREQVDEGIALLPSAFQERAKEYVFRERTSPYWYYPEFHRPGDAIAKLCPRDVSQLYAMYSSGSHGGYLGLKLLKDNPDDIHPNPRADKRSQNLALLSSVRLTFEVFRGCDRFEAAGTNDKLSKEFFDRYQELEPILRPA